MKDINDIMPKVPDMKWGALLNKKPTNKKIEELNNLLPHNGRWHTVYEEDDVSVIDGIPIIKKEKDRVLENEKSLEQINEQIETDAKYEGYLFRQRKEVERQKAYKNTPLPEDINYSGLSGLSNEAKQKLKEFSPETIGQAARIQGVTPATLSTLLVYLKKRSLKKQEAYET